MMVLTLYNIQCYELYYYLYYFKSEYFFTKYTNVNEENDISCEICSTLDKCTYSECVEKRKLQENKDRHYQHTNFTQLSKHVKFTQVESKNKPKKIKNKKILPFKKIDPKLLSGYYDIIRYKIDQITKYLDFIKNVNDNSREFHQSLLKLTLFVKMQKNKKEQIKSILRKDNKKRLDTSITQGLTTLKGKLNEIKGLLNATKNSNVNIIAADLAKLFKQAVHFSEKIYEKNKANFNSLNKKVFNGEIIKKLLKVKQVKNKPTSQTSGESLHVKVTADVKEKTQHKKKKFETAIMIANKILKKMK